MSVEMKDSGIAWVGYVPKHWEVIRLKNVFCEYNVKSENGTETLLSLSQYTGVKPKSETELAGSHEAESYEGYKIVKAGQLVMNIMLAWNGSYALSDYDGMISPAYCIYDFRTVCHKKYFHYLLRIDGYPSAFKTMSRGIIDSRLRLYPEQFYTFNTVVPPIEEQFRIANFLDKKCAEIDELIALQEQMIAQLTTYKQAVITETVTKGLDPNVQMKDSGVEWIGEIPEHWDVCRVKNISNTNSGSTPKNISESDDSNIVWIRTTDINDDIVYDSSLHISLDEFKSASCPMLPVGTCLVAMYGGGGTIGKCGVIGEIATINQALCSMEVYENYYYLYLYNILRAVRKYWMKFAVGTRKDPNINQDIVNEMWIPYPSLSEQQSIANYLDQKCKEIDELISVKKDKIEKLKAYKKSVIYEYVTGKKQV